MDVQGGFMRKTFVAFGIILLFVGVIVASASTTLLAEEKSHFSTRASVKDSWEVGPAPYKRNERLMVDFLPPNPEYDYLIPTYPLKIVVEITSSHGNKTVFEVIFKEIGGKLAPPEVNVTLSEDGLTVSDYQYEIGGIIRHTGNYTANITSRHLGTWRPKTLALKVEIVEKEYPYFFVLPIGIALIVVGGSLSVWGAKSSTRSRKLSSKVRKR